MFCLFHCHKIRPPTTNFLHKSPDRQSIIIPNNMRGLILRILLGFEIFMEKYSFMSEWWMKEFCNGFQFNNNQNLFALLLHTNFAFVFVYLCICVFVYLCICVFVHLCICEFVYLCISNLTTIKTYLLYCCTPT